MTICVCSYNTRETNHNGVGILPEPTKNFSKMENTWLMKIEKQSLRCTSEQLHLHLTLPHILREQRITSNHQSIIALTSTECPSCTQPSKQQAVRVIIPLKDLTGSFIPPNSSLFHQQILRGHVLPQTPHYATTRSCVII